MFYWSYKDIHVVLSDIEEMALVQELGKNAMERVSYHTSLEVRKKIERQIFRYLKNYLLADPHAFNRKFVFRSCYDEDAQQMFPVLLDAYGRITKRATLGSYSEKSKLDENTESVYYINTENVFRITLFGKSRWPWKQPVVYGHISLPTSSITKVAGTVDIFFVASTTATIKFHRDFVRVSILDIDDMRNKRIEKSLDLRDLHQF